MENDLNELKKDLEDFCKKYNVTIKATTYCEGRLLNGTNVYPKVSIIMEKY